ncbi:hypothetical protein RhiirC2_795176 [Rhizophagus irregularis]|uniref:Uncharacterized protein n=1 Tax=Rhizophagus irregularis TaxID=588596 RepID=A0A2N1MC33_9GLOM|nr:hypothetical protein RhiirC2_795176 [Rhizophagus irregularis]
MEDSENSIEENYVTDLAADVKGNSDTSSQPKNTDNSLSPPPPKDSAAPSAPGHNTSGTDVSIHALKDKENSSLNMYNFQAAAVPNASSEFIKKYPTNRAMIDAVKNLLLETYHFYIGRAHISEQHHCALKKYGNIQSCHLHIHANAKVQQAYIVYDDTEGTKKIKPTEALQELYHLRPEFNGKLVYFFYKKIQYVEGLLVYDKKDKTFYVFDKKTNEKFSTFASWIKFLKNKRVFSGERSALATIFFEPNSSSFNLASLLRTEQIPYWKSYNSASIAEVTLLTKTFITSNQKFFGVGIREIERLLKK